VGVESHLHGFSLQGGADDPRLHNSKHILFVQLENAVHAAHVQNNGVVLGWIPLGGPEGGRGFEFDFVSVA
jgi:hypothetical protein